MRISKWVAFVFAIALALPVAALAETGKQTTQISDVSLRADGVLVGHVVDAQGKPLQATKVQVRYGRNVIATVSSDRNGGFVVRKLRGGVHNVVTAQGSQVVRFWTEKAAPPSARKSLTLVSDKSVMRGQCADGGCATGCGDPGCGGGCGEGCGAGGFGGGGGGLFGGGSFLGLGGGGLAGTVAAAAVVGGVLAATLDDDDDDDVMTPASP